MRLEALSSIFAFGATSFFWIVVALVVSASAYGQIMQFQSALTVCVAVLTCRTYDLSFFLQRNYNLSSSSAFWTSFWIEMCLFGLSTFLIALCLMAGVGLYFNISFAVTPTEALFAAAAISSTIFQGSTQAVLRIRSKDALIVLANCVSGIAFAGVCLTLFLEHETATNTVLIYWLAAMSVRPLSLLVSAGLLACRADAKLGSEASSTEIWVRNRDIGRFLLSGQLANLVKNNAMSLETLLLGALTGDITVAVFRLSRSLLNSMVVVLNVVYQRAFPALVGFRDTAAQTTEIRKVDKRSLLVWAAMSPVCVLAAIVFAWLKASDSYHNLYIVVILMALASLPVALQQSQFTSLALNGRFLHVNVAYATGTIVLLVGSVICRSFLSAELFVIWLFLCNLSRLGLMRVFVKRWPPASSPRPASA